ncbi:ABC transporter ATP-binding protein [Pelotomaculum sp. PtaB.Bin117]|uniref:ABC transporter ATP-binding protein n=1 Tax=Pelotomaculum sp. PtaB.Bin117 TaxID=1811694 RepID=UPI0009CBB7F8|nr:ABC transporter ATP-binding protein [Pelotomaculum sp. PtaB.Bin117]OPX86981.1 MAG: putative ABC transporter ATP-binding protein YbhF [Pelotomaculum sp. PtaB.Bin117]
MSNIIKLKSLTKYYGNTLGIENVTLAVKDGEIFGFIGPNGAGKSTTIRTMLDLIHPTSGTASIFGLDCQTDGESIRQDIGYLPGEVFYYENMRVKELLEYSASFYKKDCRARMMELSAYMELDPSRKIDDLSLGNKKKVGIVQGLLHSPRLIILDEPTSGLDPLMQQKFFDLIREENKKGVTVFLSSHILSEVQRLCHRVAIIKEGRVIDIRKMDDLRENTYQKVRVVTSDSLEGFSLPGISNMTASGKNVEFLYKGSSNKLIAALSPLHLHNLWIEEPSLEEIFLHYYKDGDSDASVSA